MHGSDSLILEMRWKNLIKIFRWPDIFLFSHPDSILTVYQIIFTCAETKARIEY